MSELKGILAIIRDMPESMTYLCGVLKSSAEFRKLCEQTAGPLDGAVDWDNMYIDYELNEYLDDIMTMPETAEDRRKIGLRLLEAAWLMLDPKGSA